MFKIAISGQARTGKNTLAQMIVDHLLPYSREERNYEEHKIVAVADPIKNIVMQMVPNADSNCLWGESELRSNQLPGELKDFDGRPLTYRKALMDLGSLGRKYHNDIWLNALVQDAAKNAHLKVYLVSDVRFPNEINYFKNHGFYMVRIKRLDIPQIDDVSETAQLEIKDNFFDRIVENYGSLEFLERVAKTICEDLQSANKSV